MSTVSAEIEIAAPPEAVWDAVMDPQRLSEWVTIQKSVDSAASPPLDKGATMDQCLAIRGLTFNVHWKLVSVDCPREAHWEGVGPARSKARIEYRLTPKSEDHTIFRYKNEFQPPGGRLGNIAGRMIVGATSEREAKKSLDRLKALLERGN
jgi:uncharacterized protein YndB with AHSA1/START domain